MAMMRDLPSFTTLITEMAAPKVLLVTLNRPDFANTFNTEMAEELTARLMAPPSMKKESQTSGAFRGS